MWNSDILIQCNFPNDQTKWTKSDILKRQGLNALSPAQFPTDFGVQKAVNSPEVSSNSPNLDEYLFIMKI